MEGIEFYSAGKELKETGRSSNRFLFEKRFLRSEKYAIKLFNKYVRGKDSVQYTVSVTPDNFPNIRIEERSDSSAGLSNYFFGTATDDYGINKITFNYEITDAETGDKNFVTKIIERPGGTDRSFYYQVDPSDIGVKLEDKVEYYFEVWDNDAINGSKKTRSMKFTYQAPSEKELEEKKESNSKKVKEDLQKAMNEAADLQRKMEDIQKDLSQKRSLNWQDKKRIKDLIDQQKQMEKDLLKLNKEIEKNNSEQNQFSEKKEEILEKQEQLKKLPDTWD